MQEHSDQMVQRWKEEIDMFLVFAGLFSAVLTAFNVQSYALLQQDNSDISASALVQISAQLQSLSASATSTSTSEQSFKPDTFTVPRHVVWINTLWFSSLICTLSASSVAIMVKQWLQQYNLGLSGNSHEIARLREYRYQSLLKWRVVAIIAMLPILLQAALVMFLAGLIILLWSLHPVVAVVGSFLVSILLAFTTATTLLPAFQPDCFYQTPQALGVFRVVQAIRRILRRNQDRTTFRNWHSREKVEMRSKCADLDRGLAAKTYGIALDETTLKSTVIPFVPCILHFLTLAARSPEGNTKMVQKLLTEAWWPRMEANSEIGELFVRTMATLSSRNVERNLIFYRVAQTLSYSALDSGIRVKPELIQHIVSILPNPQSPRACAALMPSRDPRGVPLVLSYLQIVPSLVRYFARLVIDTPHDTERIQLQVDTMLNSLESFLSHVALTEDLSNLAIILWALRSSSHIAQLVSLKTDAKCSPLIPNDIVDSYQDVLANLRSAATNKAFQMYFKRHLDKLPSTNLGERDPVRLIGLVQDDLDVFARLFWMLPWQSVARRRRRDGAFPASSVIVLQY
ncbi:hypothetical protein C8Q80DRAFT_1117583 [Daedaleopsis nitida]|nr:hypothetical protein C8Q80DRAFT_1117583 [Daedaleopsis nitida]